MPRLPRPPVITIVLVVLALLVAVLLSLLLLMVLIVINLDAKCVVLNKEERKWKWRYNVDTVSFANCSRPAAVEMNNNMVSIDLNQEHGKCMAILVLLWIQQQLIFAIFVAIARKKSGLSVIL